MKIATWNVNSIRKRTGNLVDWLKNAKPDVVVLQEIKAQEATFPRLEIESAGYKAEIVGQKGFNGVALLSLHPV
ncbi:MAG TPA: endonuclease/exonuclease/phosphatase family protein, partial [Reyranella sp.]|nr:endonuclease/exonuclease/phosphatase family protein [Reyranella sp.]